MNAHTTISRPASTLADVMTNIELAPNLSATRQRDLRSDVAAIGRWLDLPLTSIKADMAELRDRLAKLHHVQIGVSEKRMRNAISNVTTALKLSPAAPITRRRKRQRSPAWQALLASCSQDWQRYRLANLATFCSGRGIVPTGVDDAVMATFREHLDATKMRKDPAAAVRMAIQTWNNLVELNDYQGLQALTRPRSAKHWSTPLTEFPVSFQQDLDLWLDRLSPTDLVSGDGPSKPLRPQSIENVRTKVRHAASALEARGVPRAEITSLSVLTDLDNYRSILRFFLHRNGNETPTWLHGIAGKLVAIARHHVKVSEDHLEEMRAIQGRLVVEREGMTDKNKKRLGQFEDLRNVSLLLGLPARVARRADSRDEPSRWDSLDVMYAVAVDILLAVPMRRANLVSIDIDRHLTWRGHGAGRYGALVIPAAEVKNGLAIEADLPIHTSRIIRRYIDHYRPNVSQDPGMWLFPKASGGGHRTPAGLANQIFAFVHRETGLEINTHLFRHLAGMLYLAQFPGQYEVVRRMLGHKSVDTTTAFYTSTESKWALKRYDENILGALRGDADVY